MTIIATAFATAFAANLVICLWQLWERTQPTPAPVYSHSHPLERRTPEDGW